jgi:hypothetical protein
MTRSGCGIIPSTLPIGKKLSDTVCGTIDCLAVPGRGDLAAVGASQCHVLLRDRPVDYHPEQIQHSRPLSAAAAKSASASVPTSNELL